MFAHDWDATTLERLFDEPLRNHMPVRNPGVKSDWAVEKWAHHGPAGALALLIDFELFLTNFPSIDPYDNRFSPSPSRLDASRPGGRYTVGLFREYTAVRAEEPCPGPSHVGEQLAGGGDASPEADAAGARRRRHGRWRPAADSQGQPCAAGGGRAARRRRVRLLELAVQRGRWSEGDQVP